MPESTQSPTDREAAARSLRAQTMIRSWRREIDDTIRQLAAKVGELAADKAAIVAQIGGDSTRPNYTEDLRAFNVQDRRLEILLDAVKRREL